MYKINPKPIKPKIPKIQWNLFFRIIKKTIEKRSNVAPSFQTLIKIDEY